MNHRRFIPGSTSLPSGYLDWVSRQIGRNPLGMASAGNAAGTLPGANNLVGTSSGGPILAVLTAKVKPFPTPTPLAPDFAKPPFYAQPWFLPYYEWQQLSYNPALDLYTSNYDGIDNQFFQGTLVGYDLITGLPLGEISGAQQSDNSFLIPPNDSGPAYALNEAAYWNNQEPDSYNLEGSVVLLYPTGNVSTIFGNRPTYTFDADRPIFRRIVARDLGLGSDDFWGEFYLKSFVSDGNGSLAYPNSPTNYGRGLVRAYKTGATQNTPSLPANTLSYTEQWPLTLNVHFNTIWGSTYTDGFLTWQEVTPKYQPSKLFTITTWMYKGDFTYSNADASGTVTFYFLPSLLNTSTVANGAIGTGNFYNAPSVAFGDFVVLAGPEQNVPKLICQGAVVPQGFMVSPLKIGFLLAFGRGANAQLITNNVGVDTAIQYGNYGTVRVSITPS